MRADQVTEPVAHHGEGPVWDTSAGRLLWVDLLQGDVLSLSPGDHDIERRHVADVAACVVPRASGGHVVAVERGFLLLGADGTEDLLPDVWSDPGVRMNDGACDPDGRLWCGSMAYDATPGGGALYRLDADRMVRCVIAEVTISNGLGWSPDGDTAYYIDSPTQRIDAFSYDGTLTERRPLVEIPADAGMPDGLTVDADGGIWVALWGEAQVRRYRDDGTLDAVVDLPVHQPTSCAFGGDDLSTLYITTSALDRPEPLAGCLFALRPGIDGLPTPAYAA